VTDARLLLDALMVAWDRLDQMAQDYFESRGAWVDWLGGRVWTGRRWAGRAEFGEFCKAVEGRDDNTRILRPTGKVEAEGR
jgi:hypothetical protein